MAKNITYESAGVSIDANDEMVERIQSYLAGTFGPRVMGQKGGFAGMFRLDYDERLFKKNYKRRYVYAEKTCFLKFYKIIYYVTTQPVFCPRNTRKTRKKRINTCIVSDVWRFSNIFSRVSRVSRVSRAE